jgi:hypothetical protein
VLLLPRHAACCALQSSSAIIAYGTSPIAATRPNFIPAANWNLAASLSSKANNSELVRASCHITDALPPVNLLAELCYEALTES